MKHFLISLFFLALTISTKSQEYIPFPLENAAWVNGYYTLNTSNPNFFFYELASTEIFESANDTMINGISYTKIVSNNENNPYAGALRQEEGKVFFVQQDSLNEEILYDFTLNPGDTM